MSQGRKEGKVNLVPWIKQAIFLNVALGLGERNCYGF